MLEKAEEAMTEIFYGRMEPTRRSVEVYCAPHLSNELNALLETIRKDTRAAQATIPTADAFAARFPARWKAIARDYFNKEDFHRELPELPPNHRLEMGLGGIRNLHMKLKNYERFSTMLSQAFQLLD